MKKTDLRKYASLIARTGAGIVKGDEVMIVSELDQPEFVEMLVGECYKAGAKNVIVDWCHQPLTKLHVRHRSKKVLGTVEEWEREKWCWRRDRLVTMIYLESEDPDGLMGINQAKYSEGLQSRMKVIKPIRDEMENKYKWCIAAVPGKKWAKKVFPGMSSYRAVEALWQAIFDVCRIGDDPIGNWERHNADLAARCDYLNSLGIDSLHYTAGNGTDFTVGMIEDCLFMGGGEYTAGKGEFFNPNIPTEEVFITPKKGVAEGIVYSSKPLSYRGQIIDNFSVRFEGGRAVEVKAERGEDLLREMIAMDEGAAYLGECALVPHDSPISNSGLLFCNTLFDENASCHLALGRGFSNCLKNYEDMSFEECRDAGINDSIIHVDFMIGCADMNITAILRDGTEKEIFKDGNWAF